MSHRPYQRRTRAWPALAAAAVAGCTAFGSEKPPPCPKVAFLYGLHTLDRLEADGRTLPVHAELSNIRGRCVYASDGIELDYGFDIRVRAEPSAGAGPFRIPYFVAVLDERGEVVGKERFVAEVPAGSPADRMGVREQLRQTLAGADRTTGPAWRVVIGFDLPPDEALARWEAREL